MQMQLLRDKLAVIPISDPSKIGNVIIPDKAKQRDDQGVVVYRGPDVKEVKVGDHVFFSGYTGSKVTLADQGVYLMMEERDILAILRHDKDSPPPLLSYSQLESVVWGVEGDLKVKGLDDQIVERVCGEILARVNALTYSEGLEF